MAAERSPYSPCRCFKTRVLHFKVKNTPFRTVKRQKMERESSKECSAFFLWRKGSFSSRNRPSRNSTLFSSRRSPWSVLKSVSVKCRLRTADCGPGVKCRESVKYRLQTESKTQAGCKMQNEDCTTSSPNS